MQCEQKYPQNFLNADEVKHIQKQAVIENLSNEVIVKKNFLHTNDRTDFNDDPGFPEKGIQNFWPDFLSDSI